MIGDSESYRTRAAAIAVALRRLWRPSSFLTARLG
jgi:hypothetical protein